MVSKRRSLMCIAISAIRVLASLSTAIIVLPVTHSADAQNLPASTTIGTNPAGTAFYAVSAGLAKVISGAGSMQSIVQPYTGSSNFLPLPGNGHIYTG